MNKQEKETVDYLAGEETDNQDFFQFTDLSLTDEQLAEVKAGTVLSGGGQKVKIYLCPSDTN